MPPVDEPSSPPPHEIVTALPDAVIGVAPDGRIDLINPTAAAMLGWSAEDLVGQQVEVLLPSLLAAEHSTRRAGFFDNPTPRIIGAHRPVSVLRRDGREIPVQISLSPVADDAGNVVVLATLTDQSQRVDIEADHERHLHDMQRLESLGQLAGGVAHDFNNLLGVILNYTTLLTRRASDPTMRADIEQIRVAAERGAALTRQLLAFARRDIATVEAIEVNAVITSIAAMLDRTLGEHIVLNLALTPADLVAMCDRTQLEQILLNLAINARDAMPAGGILRISAAATQHGGEAAVVLAVSDTGHGMTPDVTARAFEPFFTTKPRGSGSGLGLATVHRIVEQNGGEVTLQSNPGRGTTVTVRLHGADLADHAVSPIDAELPDGTERVLVVDDEAPLRLATARVLTAHGYQVLTARDGVEALEILDHQEQPFDLVVSDVAMPRMGGIQLARTLDERLTPIPTILVSGYDPGTSASRAVLFKPVGEAELLCRMREVLDA